MSELPASAPVVVVGGGIMGASALYHLALLGCPDALLVEREQLASGSTSRSAGGFRAQFSDELNVRIALECIRRYERFHEEPGADVDLKQWGYLFLLSTPAEEALFRASLALQQSLGVPSRWLSPVEAAALVPGIATDDLVGATYCPIDGYATPEAAVLGYAQAAGRLGATVVQGCPVERIVVSAGQVVGVDTTRGRVATDRVIVTAGVWSREVAATAGLALPVEPELRHIWFAGEGDGLPRELPLTIDFATGFYFHRESGGLLFGGREATLEELAPIATRRLPVLEQLEVRGGWSGFYEVSPDHNAIVGLAAEPEGLVYATGFSGHGFQQGPVIGEHVARLALGLATPFDLSAFAVERFAAGQLVPERNVV